MRNLRKFLSVVLAAALVCTTLAGCNSKPTQKVSNSAVSNSAEGNSAASQATSIGNGETITWMLPSGTVPKDLSRINSALSDYLKSVGYNMKVELQFYTWANFDTQLSTMTASQEKFDLFNNSISTANQYAVSGGVCEITDDMLTKYGPDIKSTLGDIILQNSSYNGKLYMVPVNKDMAVANGYLYNKGEADKYGIDVSGVKALDDWTPIFKQLHSKDPNIICYLSNYGKDIQENANMEMVNGIANTCAGMPLDATDKTIVNVWKNDKVKHMLNTFHEWYKAGYMNKDTTADTTALYNDGKIFCYGFQLKPGKADEQTTSTVTWGQVEITSPYVNSLVYPAGWGTAVSATSQNPNDALALINLCFKDPKFLNMIIYGQEGKDYTKNSDGYAHVNADSTGYDQSGSIAWEFGNQFLDILKDTENPNKWTEMKKFNTEGSKHISNLSGYWFNSSDYSNELTAVANAYTEYAPLLLGGSVDVDSTLNKYIKVLDDSGMPKLLSAMNDQYKVFQKSKS